MPTNQRYVFDYIIAYQPLNMMEHSGYVGLLEEDMIITNVSKMEERGYYLVNSNPEPSNDQVEVIENSVGKNELYGDLQSGTVPTKYFNWENHGQEIKGLWKTFMNIGINVALPPSIPLFLIANTCSARR